MGNQFTTTPATPPAGYGGMTLTAARPIVRYFARQAGDVTAYDNVAVDMSIQGIGDDFIAITKCTNVTNPVTLVAGTYAYDVVGLSPFADFRSDRLLRAWAVGQGDLTRPNHATMLEERRCHPGRQCRPTEIAFTSATAFDLYATPDQAYTLNLDWYQPLTAFTAGTANPDDVTLNIPPDHLRTILMYGAPALLQATDPQHKYANVSYQKYVAFRDSMTGRAGGRGSRSILRQPPGRRW